MLFTTRNRADSDWQALDLSAVRGVAAGGVDIRVDGHARRGTQGSVVLLPYTLIPIARRAGCRVAGGTGAAWWRWPIVAAMVVGVGVRFDGSWSTPGMVVWASGLGLLAASDLRCLRLPKRWVYFTLCATAGLLAVAALAHGEVHRLVAAAMAAALAEGLFALVALGWPGSLGFGDVRLIGLVGLGVGWVGPWLVAVTVVVAVVSAASVAVVGLALGRLSRSSRLPLGAFLAAGGMATVVWR